MSGKALVLVVLGCLMVVTVLAGLRLWRVSRRNRLRSMPFRDDWRRILESKVDLYRYIPVELKKQLHGHINVFLAEKWFEGCAGIRLTEEIRVVIAALACMLILNRRRTTYYPKLRSILVYPRSYVGEEQGLIGNAPVYESVYRSGESWHTGVVVIAWRDVKEEIGEYTLGRNVVMHEFAHQLDLENGADVSGTPLLEDRDGYVSWARVLQEEFRRLVEKVDGGVEDEVLDEYGARNEAEFFAVATEAFFELPVELKEAHPALYEELRKCYRVDPAEWLRNAGG